MKKHLKFLSVILTLTILVAFIPSNVFATTNKNFQEKIEFSATLNEVFTQASSQKKKKNVVSREYEITDIFLSLNKLSTTSYVNGEASLNIRGEKIYVDLIGTLNYFIDQNGYVGVFDGTTFIDDVEEQITIDMLYINEKINFIAVTIGCAGDIIPQILFFGEYSDSISALSSANIKKITSERIEQHNSSTIRETTVDATTQFQSTRTNTANGYETVTISLYHANELRNQSSMSVYAKVNSHTASFENYLADVHGYDGLFSSLSVYPDSYMIEIAGGSKHLHSNGIVSPTSGSTSQTLTFPAYLPAIGFFTFGVPITMTSTAITYRGIAISPIYNDNIIKWEVYKRSGWNASTLDGYYDEAAGGVVRAGYTFESNVTSNFDTSMGAYGQVRYEYTYTPILGASVTLHMWTEDVMCANNLVIVP